MLFTSPHPGTNGKPDFEKVDLKRTWNEAQSYCRENFVDLASIRNKDENDIIKGLINENYVWIGLHREKEWSDGSTSLFRHWADGQPNSENEECVTTEFIDSGQWSDDNCALRFPFICEIEK
uniref:C-type lectin domain-containing protein n=1 Tax=Mola mola TaxID=94237 RepID=A0A3Q3WTS3_MOLML